MARFAFLNWVLFYGAAAEEPKAEPAEELSRIEGVLWCRNVEFAEPELVAGKKVVVAQHKAPLTGVSIYVEEIGTFDVYLPDDGLKKLAQELQGRKVLIRGEVRQVVVVSKWFGDEKHGVEVPAVKGRSVWVPSASAEALPVRRPVVWANSLKAIGPKPAPLVGEPTVTRGDEKLVTFKRLPKSSDVLAVKLTSSSNAKLPDLKPLTVANFPALLDNMKPIRADDEGVGLEARASWYDCKIETVEGEFNLRLYLGGRALLRAPDFSVGWVEFEHPK